jgi:DNA-binding transcriptional MerR regulator
LPTFAAKQVCAALGVPHGTLNSWAHAGFFREFDAATTTPGKARRFSLNDLVRLSIMSRLLDVGFPTRKAKSLSQLCLHHIETISPTKIRMLTYPDNREEILLDDHKSGPEPILELIIYPRMVVAELKRRLAEADDPKVVAMSRQRAAGERAPRKRE